MGWFAPTTPVGIVRVFWRLDNKDLSMSKSNLKVLESCRFGYEFPIGDTIKMTDPNSD